MKVSPSTTTPKQAPQSLVTTQPQAHGSMDSTPETRAKTAAALAQGSSSIQRRISQNTGKAPVSLRSLINKVTRADLAQARQALQQKSSFIPLKKGCNRMVVLSTHEGYSTTSDPDDHESALAKSKALLTTKPDFPVVMILHCNTARKGPQKTQDGAETLHKYIKESLEKSGIDTSQLHFGTPPKDYDKTSIWVNYGTDHTAKPNNNSERQVSAGEFQPEDGKTHFVVIVEASTEGLADLKPDTLCVIGDNKTYTSTNQTYSKEGKEECKALEAQQQARAENYVTQQLGLKPDTPEHKAALQEHQGRNKVYVDFRKSYANSLTYASLLEVLGPNHKDALDKRLEKARDLHMGDMLVGKSPNSFYLNRMADAAKLLFALDEGEFKEKYGASREADLSTYSIPKKNEETGEMVQIPANKVFLSFIQITQIASAVKFVAENNFPINMSTVMDTLKRANGFKLVDTMKGRPLLNRQYMVDYVMERSGNLDSLQEGGADYKTGMANLLNEKTPEGGFKVSDEQLAGAVAMHLKGFEIEFNNRFPTINTKQEGIPATKDSFKELVESKEGGFSNMVLPDYDGIGAFSVLYPPPENNTETARTPVAMMYGALSLKNSAKREASSDIDDSPQKKPKEDTTA